MIAGNNNTMLIRLMLSIVGLALLALIGFIGNSMSGELKELRKGTVTAERRVSVVETMVDNIRDDTQEIKQDVKDTQEDVRTIDSNISDIKQMIMEQELRRMREARARSLGIVPDDIR